MNGDELNELSIDNNPALEEPQNDGINNTQLQIDKLKEIFYTEKNGKLIKETNDNKDYIFYVQIKNKTEKKLTPGDIKFKLDENFSDLFCKNINFLFYEKDKYQQCIITFFFDEDADPGKHTCYFDVFIENRQLKDIQFKLKITIPEQK